MKDLALRKDSILGLAVSALAVVEQPITVASAKTADVVKRRSETTTERKI